MDNEASFGMSKLQVWSAINRMASFSHSYFSATQRAIYSHMDYMKTSHSTGMPEPPLPTLPMLQFPEQTGGGVMEARA